MKNPLLTFNILMMMFLYQHSIAQDLDFQKLKETEHQLEDIMEIIDTSLLKTKLQEVEHAFGQNPNLLNKIRLGIIYHEVALNLSFFTDSEYKGYAQKSYDLLSEASQNDRTNQHFLPFVTAYRASALSLVSAETKKLKALKKAFDLFEIAIKKYSQYSYAPEFLRGSVAENLPWFLFKKRKFAKKDFESIIQKQNQNSDYANWKIMSFTYWAWANQHKGKKYRKKAMDYLGKAIELDPNYQAGRERAEKLKQEFTK